MCKKVLSLLCAIILSVAVTVSNTVYAAVIPPDSPAYSYTYECSSELSSSGSTLTCKSKATGYYNTTDKIIVNQYLQKKNSSNEWETIESWNTTINYFKGSFTNYKYSAESGTYRLKTKFKVYSGTNYETITKYSSEKTI